MTMALSGLEIFKLLPKTNCGDCGVPTCMAFAMKLAQKKAELRECPHASEQAKEILGAASEPPIRLVQIGSVHPLAVGNETVMFRHEKTFFHPAGIAVELRTSAGEEALARKVQDLENVQVERVGEKLRPDLFFVTHDSGNPEDLLRALRIVKERSGKGIILDCPGEGVLHEAVEILKGDRPAIFLRQEMTDTDIALAKTCDASLIVTARSYQDLEKQTEKARALGFNNLILNLDSDDLGTQWQRNTILRRSALKKNFKPFGYPILALLHGDGLHDWFANASLLLCKYASIIVLPDYDRALLYALLTLRQNIYTDTQKPIQVDAKVYPVGEATPDSPVFVTTNFSLTYFIVSGEIENSGISAHLLVVDTEGQSVLTSWAAGKFGGEKIAKFIKDIKLEEDVKTRKIVIPGFVAQISGDLEEHLAGWEVIVGPQEASDIQSFVKNVSLT
jgi:acetyl-CoA decarbonylase/synthase complex subunit gamma